MPHVRGAIDRSSVVAALSLDEVASRDDALDERDLGALQRAVSAFNRARDWRQFHSPKNLAMALTIEAAELAEPFRWDSEDASWERATSAEGRAHLQNEMADVLLLLLSLAEYNDIDLARAAREKLAINSARYPEEQARGRADKYTAYQRKTENDREQG
jgi:NTP pyrophosphatase (non-canonical NTP hydrolase)